ncbi:MAG: hypothetical protein K8T91_12195 [Planctomycetes bacterium]|nr:hypothetical protein [Planctomycetota bacterium]
MGSRRPTPEKPRKNDQIPESESRPALPWELPDEQLDWLEPTRLDPHLIADEVWDVLVVDEPWEPEPEPGDFPFANDQEGDD